MARDVSPAYSFARAAMRSADSETFAPSVPTPSWEALALDASAQRFEYSFSRVNPAKRLRLPPALAENASQPRPMPASAAGTGLLRRRSMIAESSSLLYTEPPDISAV